MRKTSSSGLSLDGLRKWNGWLAGVYVVQAGAILLLGTTRIVPISLSFLTVDSLQSTTAGRPVLASASQHFFDLNLGYLIAVILLLAAIAHIVAATVYRDRYEADIQSRRNSLRWAEYSLSASLTFVAVAVLAGMYEFVSLLLVFGLSVVMHLVFLAAEARSKQTDPQSWLVHGMGFVAGCLAWLAIVIYVLAANISGSGHMPGYVYGIVVSLIIICAGLAVNLFLQLRGRGSWQNYAYGERWFMILSLLAKTALAWQIFFGVLKP